MIRPNSGVLALRLGYTGTPTQPPLGEFTAEYQRVTELNRKMLDHLLHDAFPGDEHSEPEVDLFLDPDPEPARIRTVLARQNFRDVQRAYDELMSLAEEKIRFLSPRRCRHFLARSRRGCLAAIATRADPDTTLRNLARVSESLGGKAYCGADQLQPTIIGALCRSVRVESVSVRRG